MERFEMKEKNKVIRKPRGRKIKRAPEKKKKTAVPPRKPRFIGYIRVSTERQDHALQRDALIEAGVAPEDIFQDTISGSRITRKGRDACLKFLIPGDTLIVWKIDRFSRSLKDLLNQLDDLDRREVGFRSITQQIDTTTPAGRMMMQMVGAFAEFERELIRERVKAGIKATMENGRDRWGKRPDSEYDPKEVKELRKTMSVRAVARKIGISPATVSRITSKKRKKKAAPA